jgi:Mn2+/Fe2+ NRAMP family transporter
MPVEVRGARHSHRGDRSGAGDMVSSLVAGTDFGMVLLWAVVLGAIPKYFLTEGIGRWYMASGQAILQG